MRDHFDKYSAIVECKICGKFMPTIPINLKRPRTCDECLSKRVMYRVINMLKKLNTKPSKRTLEMCRKYGVK